MSDVPGTPPGSSSYAKPTTGKKSDDFSPISSGYAKPTTDTAFKIMMADQVVAESLINSLFAEVQIAPVHLLQRGCDEIKLRGKKIHAMMDYHAITNLKDHVIIEMQLLKHDDFDERALFYATSTYANQQFEKKQKWYSQIKKVYAIQFMDYATDAPGCLRYYETKDRFSDRVISGINLIQVELSKTEHIKFPIQQQLEPLEWWYYLMKYADRFTVEEIRRCRTLGMPDGIVKALKHLAFDGWDPNRKETYTKEVKKVATYYKVLEEQKQAGHRAGLLEGRQTGLLEGRQTGLLEGIKRGRVEGQVKGLINEFLAHGNLSFLSIKSTGKKSLPLEFIYEVWRQQEKLWCGMEEIFKGKSVDDFIKVLRQNDILKE
jgi:predicted transposase/invertase (TIGR01784 family)